MKLYIRQKVFSWRDKFAVKDEAIRAITDRILTLNPSADKKKIARFIQG
jgi:hypothetical protein